MAVPLAAWPGKKKVFGNEPLPQSLNDSKVLVPIALGHLWLRFNPKAKFVEVGKADGAIAHSFYQNGGGYCWVERPKSQFWASPAEDHAAQLVAQALGFFGIFCPSELLGKIKELLLLLLLGLETVLDEFDENAVGASFARLGQSTDSRRRACRQTDALANCFVRGAHVTSMHQNGIPQEFSQ